MENPNAHRDQPTAFSAKLDGLGNADCDRCIDPADPGEFERGFGWRLATSREGFVSLDAGRDERSVMTIKMPLAYFQQRNTPGLNSHSLDWR